jgi:hypothetical protein
MIQAKVFPFFLLLMGSHGDIRGSSMEAVGKKASTVQHALLVDEGATPSLKKGPPWPAFDGASAIYSGPGPPNLLSGDKEPGGVLHDEDEKEASGEAASEVMKDRQKKKSSVLFDEEAVMPHVDDASLIDSSGGSDKEVLVPVRNNVCSVVILVHVFFVGIFQSKSKSKWLKPITVGRTRRTDAECHSWN